MTVPKFVILGTGRSGSGYIAQVLTAAGIECGHEEYWALVPDRKRDDLVGDSSWIACGADLSDYQGVIFHQVRHPLAVISSLASDELFVHRSEPWFSERQRVMAEHGYEITGDNVIDATHCYMVYAWRARQWSRRWGHHWWRVENFDADQLRWIVTRIGHTAPFSAQAAIDAVPRNYNTREHPTLTWDDLPGPERGAVVKWARTFGYEAPDE